MIQGAVRNKNATGQSNNRVTCHHLERRQRKSDEDRATHCGG